MIRVLAIGVVLSSLSLPASARAERVVTLRATPMGVETVRDLRAVDSRDVRTSSSAIYGGQQVPNGHWADAAAVLDASGMGFCSGTLITPSTVLTAAHCIDPEMMPAFVALGGSHARTAEIHQVVDIDVHPQWQHTLDVALLHLDTPSRFVPRRIATTCTADRAMSEGATITIVGFGATESNNMNDIKHISQTFIDDPACTDMNQWNCNPSVSPGGEFVAVHDTNDTCYGDSGGPAYLKTGGKSLLVGVTSRGASWSGACGEGGVYVRADAAVPWIDAHVDEPLRLSSCGNGRP